MDLLIEIVLWPFVGLFEGLVGLLWPNEDPEVRRFQRFIRRLILAGIVCLLVGFGLAYTLKSASLFVICLAITFVCMILAGKSARRIENRWRSKQKRDPGR